MGPMPAIITAPSNGRKSVSKETRPRLGLMTEMVVCDICTVDVRLSVIDVPGAKGWQHSPEHDYDICPDCHADLLDIRLEEIQKLLHRQDDERKAKAS